MLTKSKETYEFEDEETALQFIEENRNCSEFTLTKYSHQKKERKRKGEIVYIVVLEKEF